MTRIAVLTTQTIHHAYFLREISTRHTVSLALLETRLGTASFPVHHAYEGLRDAHERSRWFADADPKCRDFAPCRECFSVNDAASLDMLHDARPELILVFGTGRIDPPLLQSFPGLVLNLHGGDPERYRGLDSHLWAVYHRDREGLCTCLHHVNPELDDGDIVALRKLEPGPGMELHQLRALNTETCVELALQVLAAFDATGTIEARAQRKRGRYYSQMPAVLKELCVGRFRRMFASAPPTGSEAAR